MLNFFLVIFLSTQALLLSNQSIEYGRANERSFEATFLPLRIREKGVYNIPATVELISDIVSNYYSYPAISVGRYAHLKEERDGSTKIAPILLKITQYRNLSGSFWHPCSEFADRNSSMASSFDYDENAEEIEELTSEDIKGDFDTVVTTYELSMNDLGPFSESSMSYCELQELFYSIKEMNLLFTFQSVNIGNFAVVPYDWDIDIILPKNAGRISPKIIISHRVVSLSAPSLIFTLFNVISFITSAASAVLSFIAIRQSIIIFLRTRSNYLYLQRVARSDDQYPTWSSIPLKVKVLFFELWSLFNIIGCSFIITSCLIGMLQDFGKNATAIYLAVYGLGSMFACLNLLKYFEYFPSLYLHVLTLRNAAWHVITYCLSVLPIYWAFAIFGVLNYGPYSEKFNSVGHTLVTLFSLLNGDDIYPTFTEIEDGQYPLTFISRLYLFCFVMLFITSVLNVFIFIIEDSYRTAKLYTRSPNENEDLRHQSLHKTSKTAKEILERIFYNLSIWQDRLEHHSHFDLDDLQFKSANDNDIDDNDDDDDDSHSVLLPQNKLKKRKFLSNSNQFGVGVLPVKEQFRDFSNAVFDNDFDDVNKPHSNHPTIPLQNLSRPHKNSDDEDINLLENVADHFKFLDQLQSQYLAQRNQYELGFEKIDEEFRQMKEYYDDQNNHLVKICQMLQNSLKEKS